MPVLVDTVALAAYVNPGDTLHDRAKRIMDQVLSGELGVPYLTDGVLAEGTTLLHARRAPPAASLAFRRFFRLPGHPGRLETIPTTLDHWRDALRLYDAHTRRGLSLVDCSLLVHARERGASIATFDRGFQGLAEVVA